MQNGVGVVDVALKEHQGFVPIDDVVKRVTFDVEGEQTVVFRVKATDLPTTGVLQVRCTGGGDVAEDRVEINIQEANAKRRVKQMVVIDPNDTYTGKFELAGRKGTNTMKLEMSTLLSVDISGRISELVDYPHGCLEQIVSGGFPQLYLSKVYDLSQKEADRVQSNVTSVISKMSKYRRLDGGLSYWPGSNIVNQWACIWAGHFLIEAKAMGYSIPEGLLGRWCDHAKTLAKSWRSRDGNFEEQAYRLWVLAMAGESERGAMNRLRENTAQSSLSKLLLAGAYIADGRKDIGRGLLASVDTMDTTIMSSQIFGSVERDMAIKAIVLNSVGKRTDAYEIMRKLADVLASDKWMSTQTAAWALMAVADVIERSDDDSSIKLTYNIEKNNGIINSLRQSYSKQIDVTEFENEVAVTIKNLNSHRLYLTMESVGVPSKAMEVESSRNIAVRREFFDDKGAKIDISQIEIGKDFTARVTITPTALGVKYDNIALTQLFPSGWEIRSGLGDYTDGRISYKDIRDDRIYLYFTLTGTQPLVIETRLTATYGGEFYLPGLIVESMYDSDIAASTKGQSVKVIRKP
jgi:uncharacterized protein YfaS (alpha-2-macroglobulin family)